jgi:hypothetical protein
MKRKIVLLFLACIIAMAELFAQNPYCKWFFGHRLVMDFNTPNSNPVVNCFGNTLDRNIKTSSISANGSLLFYTDGTSVWNAQQQIMPNGYLLRDTPIKFMYDVQNQYQVADTISYNIYGYAGHPVIQCSGFPSLLGTSTLIMPDPGSSSKYYILSGLNQIDNNDVFGCLLGYGLPQYATYSRPASLYYSKVNMNLNGGLGDVEVSSKRTLIKNNSGTENVCAVKHGNNINYWILTNGNTSNTLFAYEVTATGISSTPVVSTFPYNVSTTSRLKATSLGSRLAASNMKDSLFFYDFNKWTGVISNRSVVSLYNYPSPWNNFPNAAAWPHHLYGHEFSPNGKLLYFTTGCVLYQLDLSTYNLFAVKFIPIISIPDFDFGSFQIGPDYKIYVSTNKFNNGVVNPANFSISLPDVINNPNAVGAACNLAPDLGWTSSQINAIPRPNNLFEYITGYSFPNYITSMIAPWINTAPTMTTVNAITKCQFDTLSPVSLIVADTETSVSNLTLTASSSNTTLLPNSNISIGVNGAQRTLLFSPIANQTGTTTITLQLTDTNGLSSTQSFMLSILPSTPVSITSTLPISVCDGNSVVCSCAIPNNCSIEWLSNGVPTGNTSSSYTVSQSANITAVCTSSNGCTASSNAINVTVRPLPQVQCTINGPATICVGDSVQLQALSTAGYSYQWFKSTQLLPNANSAIYYAKQSGDYSYVATLNGCSKTSNAQTIKVVPAPIASITTPNTTVICNGQGALLQATTGTGYTYQWTMNGFDIAGSTNPTYIATIGSYYTVKVSNGYCARTSSPITITVNTAPVAIIHWNGTQLFSPISFYSYQWYLNGVLIPGATGQYYTPTQTGLYYVMVSNENGCKSLSPNYNLLTLSINNLSTPSLPIYPNPTSGMLQVDNFKEGTLYVYNAMGQLIIQQTEPIIDLSKQANGIYHIRAYNQAQELIGIGRVVKE